MTLYLDDGDVRLYHGHVLDELRAMPSASVDCIVTSPPYYGLRDYGTARWEGGDETCDHVAPARGGTGRETLGGGLDTQGAARTVQYAGACGKCGSRRVDGQIGLEATPALFLDALVDVFREVRRVLADHGTCWVNLGDSYATTPAGNKGDRYLADGGAFRADKPFDTTRFLPAKNLLGMPWRLAFALQDDRWILRRDIIWAKPNPMPESVTDRCTSAHEYVFMLVKKPRYWYDADAVREAQTVDRSQATIARQGAGESTHENYANRAGGERWPNPAGRNLRSVWEIATQPTPEAHFATYPEELVRRCILAGCKPGGTVLDPFVGSGTTCKVARYYQRKSIGIDLNAEYLEIAAKRLQQLSLLGGIA